MIMKEDFDHYNNVIMEGSDQNDHNEEEGSNQLR